MGRPKTPHQAGELALGRGCPYVPINSTDDRRVGGAGAAWSAVDVVKLEKRKGEGNDSKEGFL